MTKLAALAALAVAIVLPATAMAAPLLATCPLCP